MPEYLAPGVYVEEVSFRSKSIEGVGTTTTGFVGPTRYGPVKLEPDIVTSLAEFERVYGDRQQFSFDGMGGEKMPNFMWHAARAFFEEGGKRLYVSRIFRSASDTDDGFAKAFFPAQPKSGPDKNKSWLKISARFPGELGEMRVWLTLRLGQSVLGKTQIEVNGQKKDILTFGSLMDRDVVYIDSVPVKPPATPPETPPETPPSQPASGFYLAFKKRDPESGEIVWEFQPLKPATPAKNVKEADLSADKNLIRIVNLSVSTKAVNNPDAETQVYDSLALDPQHKRAETPDSVFDKLALNPANASEARRIPIVIERNKIDSGLELIDLLLSKDFEKILLSDESSDDDRSITLLLAGGNDGARPLARDYEGEIDDQDRKTGLRAFEDIEDISIVAAPGSTYNDPANAPTVTNLLISHAERMRYRIAVLDSANDQAIVDVRATKAKIDSKYAAFYYPWVRVLDPVTQQEINLPPSGFVSGIYARNDVERAVYKAPANEVVRLAIGFEKTLNKAQQEVLNPEGINCFRFFEGRGFRLWGARTTSSDPEWKYVNLRRYFAYLERSIDRGTQWAVFEPNGEALWANVRQTIQDFLYNEWVSGALLGEKPEKAYFVKCDRSTMTQNDLDNGRLVCLIGVAVVKPAEFVIFRIGQWTADRKV
jgi:phage tail sheath protein FI